MKIWVDADACPVVIKEILYKAAERTGLQLILVANTLFRVPTSSFIHFIRVPQGADKADDEIVKQLIAEDLVITADIPLAARVVNRGCLALNPRGEVYTEDNIQERLSTRDFLESLRLNGVESGGPPAFNARDKQHFANKLDQILTKYNRQRDKRHDKRQKR
ncbi:MAG: YaiI/YqxD family protein [Candidatus Electrothrix sp. AW3_4]|nr:YaiI/YqxD family protein [Candidatus Electrothrix gigas]